MWWGEPPSANALDFECNLFHIDWHIASKYFFWWFVMGEKRICWSLVSLSQELVSQPHRPITRYAKLRTSSALDISIPWWHSTAWSCAANATSASPTLIAVLVLHLYFLIFFYGSAGNPLKKPFKSWVLLTISELRSMLGNHIAKSGPWEFNTKWCWCSQYHPRWAYKTYHQRLARKWHSGGSQKVGFYSWLA